MPGPLAPTVLHDELRPDETILHVAHRHVIVLIMHLILPVIVVGASLSLVWYRLSQAPAIQPFGVMTITLVVIALLTLLLILYLYVDWQKDQIVLTDQRVIYNTERPLIRRTQEQLPINDIHHVEAVTRSYPEHWLKFGSIEIQSASFGRPMIFRRVSHPQQLQDRVMDLLHSLKREQVEADDFHDMVSRRVYRDEPPQPAQAPAVQRSNHPRMLHWLFHPNPHYDEETHTYTWHPHWFFLLKELFKPGTLMLLALVIVFGGAQMGLLTEAWVIGLLLGAGLVSAVWAAWEIEDHRNDRYILSPSQVTDIEKQPFGPENQSSASLDSIQNVTFTTTLFSRLMGYGDVWLELTGSGDHLTFYDVPHPRDVVSAIDSYQSEFNKSQKERNMEDMLHLLHSYHELQQQEESHEEEANGSPRDHDDGSTEEPDEQRTARQRDDALLHHLLLGQEQS